MSSLRQPTSSHDKTSPTLITSPQFLQPHLPDPSSSTLNRITSRSSQHAGSIPSPRPPTDSRRSSFKVVSRQGSMKDKHKGHGKEVSNQTEYSEDSFKSPMSESGSVEVIETGAVKVQKDHDSGRWMINQYRVLREIGHGTHGRVRLGEDLSAQLPIDEDGDVGLGISHGGPFYAIKIVDRNPKRKRLTGLGRQKMKSSRDGAKMLNESEIRKEIAIFKKVNHPNVVRMKEIIDDPESSKIYMIMEWCENGEINWKEAEASPALTVGETRKIFRDTLLGLEYRIIHRDIKPSNLLRAADNTVKISDFGCSHYSEALREASALPGPEGDAYVDDIELAKTAGSPAFFAPEMCYSGLDTDITQRSTSSPQSTPMTEVPSFTLRPPSAIETRSSQSDPSNLGTPLRPTFSNDSSRRPPSARSHSSSATIHRRERLPITNAIDVWALGVTLYCLFFGKTPFDAANEYLLMQVIPVQDYVVPPFVGKDHLPTGTGGLAASEEAKECLDLLRKLLEKDPAKRITLEQAKTDPHTQTFVTVSNDEVAAVVTKSTGFRDRFRKGIKSIGHKLQLLSGANRSRSHSIGEVETPGESSGTPRSSKLLHMAPSSRDISPMHSPLPAPSLTRRISLLGSKLLPGESPPGTSPNVSGQTSPESGSEVPTPSVSSVQSVTGRNFMVQRRPSSHLVPPVPAALASDDAPRSPRTVPSSSSLDKVKSDTSPHNSIRRGSADVEAKEPFYRPRTHSNASSMSGRFTGWLRSGSQRRRKQDKELLVASDVEEPGNIPSVASSSPADALGRISLDEMPRRSLETFESSSYNSQSRGLAPSPERGTGTWNWDNRLRAGPVPERLRRESGRSEEFHRPTVDEEEVDWNGAISLSDDDDYVDDNEPSSSRLTTLKPSAPNLPLNWRSNSRDGLGLELPPSTTPITTSQPVPVAITPTLDPIPDDSPTSLPSNLSVPPSRNGTSPANPIAISSNEPLQRTPSRTSSRLSQSPYRSSFLGERAKSPLGININPNYTAGEQEYTSSPRRVNALTRQTSASVFDLEEHDDTNDDVNDDQGLAISIGSRRGRKGSMLSNR